MATLTFPIDNALAQELGADRDRLLEAVAERAGARVSLRGNEVIAEGSDAAVAQVRLLLEELAGLVEQGLPVGQQTVDAVVGVLDAHGRSVDVLHDVVWRHRGKKIAPKTLNQKRYVDAIRSSTVTFGVGPAGTGKTYLAMALAVSALDDRSVARIILTRPAVEAGERLGFLPGDMLAKVDPYLRPLFDALYDMLDADRLAAYMEKGIDRGRPARVHARSHAQRLVHRARRGAEHDARADADVPHAARLRLQDRGHGRPDAERPRRAASAPAWPTSPRCSRASPASSS